MDQSFQVNLSRLRYFQAILEHGSIRSAAERLNTAPSVVSRQLHLLESEIGTPLFDRRHHGMIATEAADLLLEYAHTYRIGLEQFHESLHGELRGRIEIALTIGYVESLMDSVVADFLNRHPHVSIELNVRTANGVVDDVVRKRAHIGLTYNPSLPPGIRECLSVSHPTFLAVAPDHPLTRHNGPLEMRDAVRYPLAMMPAPHFGVGQIVYTVAHAENIPLAPRFVTNSPAALRRFVRSGDGVAFLTHLLIADDLDEGKIIALRMRNPLFNSPCGKVIVHGERPLPRAAAEILTHIQRDLPSFKQ
ncbi:LysR family transcriptional regulator [Burkholderia singularis]|uniref:LysR family transcriptional regulator n=1 Tax=Burkholderia singularis TaxID=1503053 RepID=A0A103E7U0_9BURK|nr:MULTISPECIES: LysR family transcriptional regulator [Burkholderia]AOK32486.1 LysR family transcriptional regulator [Burkholderia sp. Bp7605]KVE29967.1 LysR family transcriptional regulator [Burkholderia singularis]